MQWKGNLAELSMKAFQAFLLFFHQQYLVFYIDRFSFTGVYSSGQFPSLNRSLKCATQGLCSRILCLHVYKDRPYPSWQHPAVPPSTRAWSPHRACTDHSHAQANSFPKTPNETGKGIHVGEIDTMKTDSLGTGTR